MSTTMCLIFGSRSVPIGRSGRGRESGSTGATCPVRRLI